MDLMAGTVLGLTVGTVVRRAMRFVGPPSTGPENHVRARAFEL
jgi:hypothetical protein